MMGVEPTSPAWKDGELADVLHLHIQTELCFQNPFLNIYKQIAVTVYDRDFMWTTFS